MLRDGETTLGEGSIYERLRRNPDTPFDPQVGTGALVLDDVHRDLLADVHRGYARIALDAGLPLLLQTDTWRCTATRIAASRWQGTDLNAANAELLRRAVVVAHVVKHSDDRSVGGLDDIGVKPRQGQLRIVTHGAEGLEVRPGTGRTRRYPALATLADHRVAVIAG